MLPALTIATVNVNGVRAAVRRGMAAWLAARRPDVLALQEVRASDEVLCAALEESLGGGWHVAHREPTDPGTKGRAGVAVATRLPVGEVRSALDPRFDGAGRWVELDVEVPGSPGAGVVTVASTYVHTGQAGTPRQAEKMAFLGAVARRMGELAAAGRPAVVCGDLNVAHTEADIKNWRGNLAKAGFLPEERAWFSGLLEAGWVDVVRALHPEGPGPYAWWSWRGTAFDTDAGWRIDHQLATPDLAATATEAVVDRAASYAERFSDHAPVVVRYEIEAPSAPSQVPDAHVVGCRA